MAEHYESGHFIGAKILQQVTIHELLANGAGNRVRTDDLLITNQLLYQLSYAGVHGQGCGCGRVFRTLRGAGQVSVARRDRFCDA